MKVIEENLVANEKLKVSSEVLHYTTEVQPFRLELNRAKKERKRNIGVKNSIILNSDLSLL